MKVIIIPADPREDIHSAEFKGYADFTRTVGGYIQVLAWPDRNDVACYCNEEGKQLELPPNERATSIFAPVLGYGDFIVGNLVVFGSRSSDETDVPDDFMPEVAR